MIESFKDIRQITKILMVMEKLGITNVAEATIMMQRVTFSKIINDTE